MRAVREVLLVIVLLVVHGGNFAAQAQGSDPGRLFGRSLAAVRDWGTTRSAAVDPRLTYEIAGTVAQFAAIYGSAADLHAAVGALLGDRLRMNRAVAAFLDDSMASAEVRSLYDRLASEVGSSAQASGWPSAQFNQYRHVKMPAGSDPVVLIAPASQGGDQGGARSLLLGFGTHLVRLGGCYLAVSAVPVPGGARADAVPAGATARGHAAWTYRVQPDPSWYCEDPAGANDLSPPPGQLPLEADMAPFYNASSLSIRLEDPDAACGPDCRRALEAATVQSVAQWRGGCGRCRSSSLKAIAVQDGLWFDDELVTALSYAVVTGREPSQSEPDFAALALGRMHFRPFGTQPASGYHRVSDTPLAEALCKAGLGRVAGRFAEARLCGRTAAPCREPDCMAFTITLGQRASRCQLLGRARLACGSADDSVAFNTDHYRFELPFGTGEPIRFGRSDRVVDGWKILVHETGHWFRLPHGDGDSRSGDGRWDVMAEMPRLERNMCITLSSLAKIDSAAMSDWPGRLGGDEGFPAPPGWDRQE